MDFSEDFTRFLSQLRPNLAPTSAPRPLQKRTQIYLKKQPVLIRNGKRVIFSKLPAASCCVWRDVAPLASLAALVRSLRSHNLKIL